jgi:hypothetical protein
MFSKHRDRRWAIEEGEFGSTCDEHDVLMSIRPTAERRTGLFSIRAAPTGDVDQSCFAHHSILRRQREMLCHGSITQHAPTPRIIAPPSPAQQRLEGNLQTSKLLF